MTEHTQKEWFDPKETTFGDRIAGARETAGLSQEDLAGRLGVRLETIEDWENDISEPRGNRISIICGVLNVSIRWLLSGEGNGPVEPYTELTTAQVTTELRHVRAQMMSALDRIAHLENMLAEQES